MMAAQGLERFIMTFRVPITFGATVGLAVMLAGCGINSVPTAEEAAKQKWGDVESAYQRRNDTIPNIAATVKGAVAAEDKVLTDVMSARAKATSVQVNANDLTDPAKIAEFQSAQNAVTGSLSRLIATVEAYPNVKSQDNFPILMSQIDRENARINVAQIDYNKAVRDYNTLIRTFPDAVGAKIFYGAKPLQPFKADEGAKANPKVEVGGGN
jgi:LemA protein